MNSPRRKHFEVLRRDLRLLLWYRTKFHRGETTILCNLPGYPKLTKMGWMRLLLLLVCVVSHLETSLAIAVCSDLR